MTSSSEQRRNPSFCRDDDGGTRVGERVSLRGMRDAVACENLGETSVTSIQSCQPRPKSSPGSIFGSAGGPSGG